MMELVDMRGLKPRPFRVLVQVQVWVEIKGLSPQFRQSVFTLAIILSLYWGQSTLLEVISLSSIVSFAYPSISYLGLPILVEGLTPLYLIPHYATQASHLFFFYLFVWVLFYRLGSSTRYFQIK
jgi:hypothetical protein